MHWKPLSACNLLMTASSLYSPSQRDAKDNAALHSMSLMQVYTLLPQYPASSWPAQVLGAAVKVSTAGA